jgi:hypothetical protein
VYLGCALPLVGLPVNSSPDINQSQRVHTDVKEEIVSSSRLSPSTTVPFAITPAPTHPPIPVANTPALPAEFSDVPQSVVSCWDAYANYSTADTFLRSELLKSENYTWTPWTTTSYSLSTYLNGYFACNTTALPSLTTLCDGYPRASTTSSSCQTVTETYTWTVTGEASYYTPAWSTELEQLQPPTCTIASDFGPECTRLKDAYDWRTSHFQSQVPSPSGSIEGPGCKVLITPVPSANPTCYLAGGSWEAFHWPSPLPTGSAFCNTNGTNVTATPTIPGQANTAVISGMTLTSPSVYYLLRNVTLQTFAGHASLIGDASTGPEVFLPSTTAPLLTVKQREADILTISRICAGSNRGRYCTYHASPGFSVADLATVRASEYCGWWGCYTGDTILQDKYKPTLGVPVSDIVAQNGVFTNCAWTTPGARVRTRGPAVYSAGKMKLGDWLDIKATKITGRGIETTAP